MENTDKYTASVDGMPKESETGEFMETPSESAFFQQLEKNLKKYAADMSAPNPLEMLCENFHRLHHLFVTFGHLWPVHNGIIQKACAWYLAYAKPSEEEIHTLMETLEGLTRSAYSLAEGSALTTRMRKFFITGEQGLRHLFNYEEETKQKHQERMERLRAEGPAYCITIGGEEIYGVLYSQIEKLYKTMGRFIEREKAPFECKVKGCGEYDVSISKDISLCADRDEFYVNYSLGSFGADFDSLPAEMIQRVAGIISGFLKVFGENGDRKVRWDMADYPRESQPDITFTIKEDERVPLFRTVPWISKRIHQDEGEETEIAYYVDINEIPSPELSFGEFVALYRKLGDYLDSRIQNAELDGN